MTAPLKTAIIGFGKMGQGYADDPVMARHFRYAVHAQVLVEHPRIHWQVVIDPSAEAQAAGRERWGVPVCVADPAELGPLAEEIELVVLATNPDMRLSQLDSFPALRAVLVEKPLGTTLANAEHFLDGCAERGIMVQVNIWRRADRAFRALAAWQLAELVGRVQSTTFLYGNGLMNNGTHMVDFARMLFGEVAEARLLGADAGFTEGPLAGDRNPRFVLTMVSGQVLDFQPLRFANYRENGLISWGERGRLDILNEGLTIAHYPRVDNRAMAGEREVAANKPEFLPPSAGVALYDMYENLITALDAGNAALLVSPGDSALATARIVDAVFQLTPHQPAVSFAV